MAVKTDKKLIWIGDSREKIRKFPEAVKDDLGFALHEVQRGNKPFCAKPLKGFKGAGVLEIVENYQRNTYRAVYTVRFAEIVYVLHCFQKKSKKNIKTPRQDIELIKKRLNAAEKDYTARYSQGSQK